MMSKKLKLFGSGNKDSRFFFIFEKKDEFFSLFPIFLIGCGFKNLGIYEDYQEKIPNSDGFENVIQNFKNQNYDIDVIFTDNRIILIIRTETKNKEFLIEGIKNISSF